MLPYDLLTTAKHILNTDHTAHKHSMKTLIYDLQTTTQYSLNNLPYDLQITVQHFLNTLLYDLTVNSKTHPENFDHTAQNSLSKVL